MTKVFVSYVLFYSFVDKVVYKTVVLFFFEVLTVLTIFSIGSCTGWFIDNGVQILSICLQEIVKNHEQ